MGDIKYIEFSDEAKRLSKEIVESLKTNDKDVYTVYDENGNPLFRFDSHWFDEYLKVKNKEG